MNPFLRLESVDLTFAELRRASCSFEAVLFAFLHTGIAGQQAGFLQGSAKLRIRFAQRAADAMTDCSGLTGQAAAFHVNHHVVIANVGQVHGLTNGHLQGFKTEIIVDIALVDHDLSIAGHQTNAGNSLLATADSTVFSLCHISYSFPRLITSGPALQASVQPGHAQHRRRLSVF